MKLHDLLEQVNDRESFFRFVQALSADRADSAAQEQVNPSNPYGPEANGWENGTIENYLEAALSWAESTGMGQSQGLPAKPSWKAFAVFLYCGKIYE